MVPAIGAGVGTAAGAAAGASAEIGTVAGAGGAAAAGCAVGCVVGAVVAIAAGGAIVYGVLNADGSVQPLNSLYNPQCGCVVDPDTGEVLPVAGNGAGPSPTRTVTTPPVQGVKNRAPPKPYVTGPDDQGGHAGVADQRHLDPRRVHLHPDRQVHEDRHLRDDLVLGRVVEHQAHLAHLARVVGPVGAGHRPLEGDRGDPAEGRGATEPGRVRRVGRRRVRHGRLGRVVCRGTTSQPPGRGNPPDRASSRRPRVRTCGSTMPSSSCSTMRPTGWDPPRTCRAPCGFTRNCRSARPARPSSHSSSAHSPTSECR